MNSSDVIESILVSCEKYEEVEPGDIYGHESILYLFGDNVVRKGSRGQDVIRHAENSIGIITKRSPSESEDAYLMDSDLDLTSQLILSDILKARELLQNGTYDYISIPVGGLGTGAANLKERSPETFDFLSYAIYQFFGFVNPGWTIR